MAIKITY